MNHIWICYSLNKFEYTQKWKKKEMEKEQKM